MILVGSPEVILIGEEMKFFNFIILWNILVINEESHDDNGLFIPI